MQYQTKSNRLHVWLLVSNISLAPPEQPDCWQFRTVDYTTRLLSPDTNASGADAHALLHQLSDTNSSAHPAHPVTAPAAGVAAPHGRRLLQSQSNGSGASSLPPAAALGPSRTLNALSFAFMRDAFVLPAAAADQFFQIQNATLLQLPQGPDAAAAADATAGPWPPDLWTVLLLSINRCGAQLVRACFGKNAADCHVNLPHQLNVIPQTATLHSGRHCARQCPCI
jgi:hypothetical protein